MNNDLISRSALLEALNKLYMAALRKTAHSVETIYELDHLAMLVKDAPAVDAEAGRHGQWIMRGGYIRCSECDAKTLWKDAGGTGGFSHEYEQVRANYCPNCGVKMRNE